MAGAGENAVALRLNALNDRHIAIARPLFSMSSGDDGRCHRVCAPPRTALRLALLDPLASAGHAANLGRCIYARHAGKMTADGDVRCGLNTLQKRDFSSCTLKHIARISPLLLRKRSRLRPAYLRPAARCEQRNAYVDLALYV